MPKRSKPSPPVTVSPSVAHRRWRRPLLCAAMVVAIAASVFADWWIGLPTDATASYVGGQSCVACHADQHAKWQGSYHDLAMDRATTTTVLGDFNNTELRHFGLQSRMFRRNEKYFVNTEGPDGKFADFEVKYVLGVAPLQQYMVEFDRPADAQPDEIGRMQVLPIAWDTTKKQWFLLQPPDVADRILPGDDLHWTGVAQRWNNMCADCHVTNLNKNFDVATKSYHTSFTDIDVNCEACHGPGSLHVQLATAKSPFWDRQRGYALAKLKGANPTTEIHACAPCHSMRRIVEPGFRAGDNYFDHFANELLHGHLYHADGQMLEEVYEFGSFTQSKMFHKNIRCTDCHDPHTTKVKHEGNKVCTSCHQHPAGKYDSPAHHHHDPTKAGALCTSCHMPKKTYMAVDPRLDHSLRIPRPDLSVQLGTPNACSGCHLEKAELPPERVAQLGEYAEWLRAARTDDGVKQALAKVDRWSADQFRTWYGTKADAETHFAHTLAAARRGAPNAEAKLIALARRRELPAIVRATCVSELGQFDSEAVTAACVALVKDDEPLVRIAALVNLERLPDEPLVRVVSPVLKDSVRAVRAEAGRVLARVNERWLDGKQRAARTAAIDEYRRGLLANSDRAGAHLGLAALAESLGDLAGARAAYETAIGLEPTMAGSRANLAALLDREAEASQDPARIATAAATTAKLRREELDLLARDSKLVPDNASLRYRYGMSLYLHGDLPAAERELLAAARLAPNTPDFAFALALLYQKQQRLDDALAQSKRLLELRPDNPTYRQFDAELRAERGR